MEDTRTPHAPEPSDTPAIPRPPANPGDPDGLLDGLVTVNQLAAHYGVATSTIRMGMRGKNPWVPTPSAAAGRTALWRWEDVWNLTRPERGGPRAATPADPTSSAPAAEVDQDGWFTDLS